MVIDEHNHVFLGMGETFIQEEQAPDNIMRIATYKLRNGNHVLIERHFSQIGPVITDAYGHTVETTVVNGKVVPREREG